MNFFKPAILSIISVLFLISCDKDDTIVDPIENYETGFFVINEGSFSNDNASVTYVSQDYTTVKQDLYQSVNEEGLGDVAQSTFVVNDKAYIIMNGSDKIVVVDLNTMKKLETIEDPQIKNPRYLVARNGLGYVSNWGVGPDPNDDSVVIIDLATNTVTDTFSVGFVPDRMVIVGDYLYVNLQGWYPLVNNITEVIDLTTNTVVKDIEVGEYPTSIIYQDNLVYVMSSGSFGVTGGKISVINPHSNVVTKTLEFTTTENPSNLTYGNNGFYYSLDGKVFKWNGISDIVPMAEENGLDGSYYSMTIKNGLIYVTDAGDFTSEGSLQIFDLSDNSSVETISTGIVPNGIIFL